MSQSRRPWGHLDTDREILAAAIKRTEEEMALFPEADFPEEHRQARALVAAGKEKLERMRHEEEGR